MKKQIVRVKVEASGYASVERITEIQCIGEQPIGIDEAVAWASIPGNEYYVAGGLGPDVAVEVVRSAPAMVAPSAAPFRPYLRTRGNALIPDNLLSLERIPPSLAGFEFAGLAGKL